MDINYLYRTDKKDNTTYFYGTEGVYICKTCKEFNHNDIDP